MIHTNILQFWIKTVNLYLLIAFTWIFWWSLGTEKWSIFICKDISSTQEESSGHAQSETVDNEGETTKTLSDSDSVTSIADEPSKLAQLRDQGVITETEFVQMKGNLIENIDAWVLAFENTLQWSFTLCPVLC